MICVVGSGPSGATTAHFLWRAGFDVMLLDAGLTLEPRLVQDVEDYLADPDSDRFVAAVEHHRSASATDERTLPDKMSFGSDFAYRDVERHVVAAVEDADVRPSLALGGLSNVWGSAVLPVAARDVDEWPISADQLAPYYRALDEIVDVVGEPDGLDICFGDVTGTRPDFPLGRQGAALLADLIPHRARLAEHGIHFGRARLAVGKMYSRSNSGCVSCGLCIHGCPYGAIFNAAHVVERLRRQERFEYRGNLIVERFVEHDDTVTVYARELRDGARYTHDFERVFVAAGAVSTTAIVARSLDSGESRYRLRDSQLFVFPILRPERAAGAMTEHANRLAQIFIEIDNPDICERLIHLQLYGYNHLTLVALRRRFGRVVDLFPTAIKHLLERTIIVQGFLHSDVSGTIHVDLPASSDDGAVLPRLKGESNPHSHAVIRRALRLLTREWRRLRGMPISRQLLIPPPGSGHHLGGSLPMRHSPRVGETDLLGRPKGLKRVHVVDATVLPSVPASTITYTVMANAARIATEAAREFGRAAS